MTIAKVVGQFNVHDQTILQLQIGDRHLVAHADSCYPIYSSLHRTAAVMVLLNKRQKAGLIPIHLAEEARKAALEQFSREPSSAHRALQAAERVIANAQPAQNINNDVQSTTPLEPVGAAILQNSLAARYTPSTVMRDL